MSAFRRRADRRTFDFLEEISFFWPLKNTRYTMTELTLSDPELGEILLRPHARASRLTFRVKDGRLHLSLPPGTPAAEVRKAIDRLRPRLQKLLGAGRLPLIDCGYRIDADLFHLALTQGEGRRFLLREKPDEVQITCPAGTDFHDESLQAWLRKAIMEALHRRAKDILPARLDSLARRHGLAYRSVKINTGHTRWGSCSARGDINLSCYLLLLPARLVDYVLLHELAHTREMNHGPGFRALLEQLTDGQDETLRCELKQWHTVLPSMKYAGNQ